MSKSLSQHLVTLLGYKEN
jgi:hypothetical protein